MIYSGGIAYALGRNEMGVCYETLSTKLKNYHFQFKFLSSILEYPLTIA